MSPKATFSAQGGHLHIPDLAFCQPVPTQCVGQNFLTVQCIRPALRLTFFVFRWFLVRRVIESYRVKLEPYKKWLFLCLILKSFNRAEFPDVLQMLEMAGWEEEIAAADGLEGPGLKSLGNGRIVEKQTKFVLNLS